MQQTTTRQLYAYWDRVRNGRVAPRRFEIEPAKIATLLPETFIAECEGQLAYRFRLAGTKICEQFGRELRGGDLLSLWDVKDRDAFASLLRNVISDAAIGLVSFHAYSDANRQAKFELVVMPLIHTGAAINRLLGAITAVEPPFWLGSVPLVRQEVIELHLHWPDGAPRACLPPSRPSPAKRRQGRDGKHPPQALPRLPRWRGLGPDPEKLIPCLVSGQAAPAEAFFISAWAFQALGNICSIFVLNYLKF